MRLVPNLSPVSGNLALDEPSHDKAVLLDQYEPPYDLLSDMLFVLALCRTAPLRQAFPEQPFLSLGGKTPLLMWYSRVREIRYWHEGERGQLGGEDSSLYNELNIIALLRQRAFFVPAIYATSDLTLRIGHAYGMPKQKAAIMVQIENAKFYSTLRDGTRSSKVEARLLGPARALGGLFGSLWPWRIWPIHFPDGRTVRGLIQATPCVQPAWVRGQLCLETAWLPERVSLLPVGLYLADQQMQLPPPDSCL